MVHERILLRIVTCNNGLLYACDRQRRRANSKINTTPTFGADVELNSVAPNDIYKSNKEFGDKET
jgi:hypothetical protein